MSPPKSDDSNGKNGQRIDELTRLIVMADELAQETRRLGGETADSVAALGRRAKKNRNMIVLLALSMVLDVLLTVLIGIGFNNLQQQSNELDAITNRLDNSQTVQRQKGLCPLYTLFYSLTDTPEERAEGKKRSANPESYDHSVEVIHEGYKNLKCAEFKGDAPELYKR